MHIRLLSVMTVVLVGCSGADPMRGDDTVAVRDENLHALMAGQLDVLMARIQTLAYDQNRTVDELDQERRRQLRQLELIAEGMQRAAAGVLAVLPQLGLAEPRASQFSSLAGQLDAQSRLLQQAAANGDPTSVTQHVNQIQQTCQSCHQLYRGL